MQFYFFWLSISTLPKPSNRIKSTPSEWSRMTAVAGHMAAKSLSDNLLGILGKGCKGQFKVDGWMNIECRTNWEGLKRDSERTRTGPEGSQKEPKWVKQLPRRDEKRVCDKSIRFSLSKWWCNGQGTRGQSWLVKAICGLLSEPVVRTWWKSVTKTLCFSIRPLSVRTDFGLDLGVKLLPVTGSSAGGKVTPSN